MARIFITGSSSGLGLIAGRQLAERGHRVVLHARDAAKAEAARGGLPQVEGIVEGDLETLAGMRAVAEQVNALGRLDAVIHNAGVGERGTDRLTADGVPMVFAVNVLAPHVPDGVDRATRPARLSQLQHALGGPACASRGALAGRTLGRADLLLAVRSWLRRLPLRRDSGPRCARTRWIRAGCRRGWAAPPLRRPGEGARTQGWLAEGTEPEALVTGQYLHHRRITRPDPATWEASVHEEILSLCATAA